MSLCALLNQVLTNLHLENPDVFFSTTEILEKATPELLSFLHSYEKPCSKIGSEMSRSAAFASTGEKKEKKFGLPEWIRPDLSSTAREAPPTPTPLTAELVSETLPFPILTGQYRNQRTFHLVLLSKQPSLEEMMKSRDVRAIGVGKVYGANFWLLFAAFCGHLGITVEGLEARFEIVEHDVPLVCSIIRGCRDHEFAGPEAKLFDNDFDPEKLVKSCSTTAEVDACLGVAKDTATRKREEAKRTMNGRGPKFVRHLFHPQNEVRLSYPFAIANIVPGFFTTRPNKRKPALPEPFGFMGCDHTQVVNYLSHWNACGRIQSADAVGKLVCSVLLLAAVRKITVWQQSGGLSGEGSDISAKECAFLNHVDISMNSVVINANKDGHAIREPKLFQGDAIVLWRFKEDPEGSIRGEGFDAKVNRSGDKDISRAVLNFVNGPMCRSTANDMVICSLKNLVQTSMDHILDDLGGVHTCAADTVKPQELGIIKVDQNPAERQGTLESITTKVARMVLKKMMQSSPSSACLPMAFNTVSSPLDTSVNFASLLSSGGDNWKNLEGIMVRPSEDNMAKILLSILDKRHSLCTVAHVDMAQTGSVHSILPSVDLVDIGDRELSRRGDAKFSRVPKKQLENARIHSFRGCDQTSAPLTLFMFWMDNQGECQKAIDTITLDKKSDRARVDLAALVRLLVKHQAQISLQIRSTNCTPRCQDRTFVINTTVAKFGEVLADVTRLMDQVAEDAKQGRTIFSLRDAVVHKLLVQNPGRDPSHNRSDVAINLTPDEYKEWSGCQAAVTPTEIKNFQQSFRDGETRKSNRASAMAEIWKGEKELDRPEGDGKGLIGTQKTEFKKEVVDALAQWTLALKNLEPISVCLAQEVVARGPSSVHLPPLSEQLEFKRRVPIEQCIALVDMQKLVWKTDRFYFRKEDGSDLPSVVSLINEKFQEAKTQIAHLTQILRELNKRDADGSGEDGESMDGEPEDGESMDGEPEDGESMDGEPEEESSQSNTVVDLDLNEFFEDEPQIKPTKSQVKMRVARGLRPSTEKNYAEVGSDMDEENKHCDEESWSEDEERSAKRAKTGGNASAGSLSSEKKPAARRAKRSKH